MLKETNKRFLSELTEEEFFQKLDERLGIRSNAADNSSARPRPTGRLVYGLRGIQDLFNCSHKTAQHYKDHVIMEAVTQNGRKIVVDADLALQLFKERGAK